MFRRWRRRARCDENGAALLEFALVTPLLLTLLLGVIDFGVVFNGYESLRNGVGTAARTGAITLGAFNNAAPSCTLTGEAGASNDVQDLMCLAKSEINVTGTRIKVMFDNPAFTSSGASYAVGNEVVVCAIYPLSSVTGLFAPVLNGRYVSSKAAFSIEQLPSDSATETAGAETDPSGKSWSWCQS